jgi:ATP-binding cassette subfamily F protein uup
MNLVNLEAAVKAYGARVLLDQVSLGVAAGDRIGVVGRNGSGKTTLLAALAGTADLNSGRSTRSRDARIGYLPQSERLAGPVRQIVFGELPEHEWAADARGRAVLAALLSDIDLMADAQRLSGGESRRVALAALLRGTHDLLLLDEPTNHLDIEAIRWLAGYLVSFGKAFVVVTHDRWFLDAVSEQTWEIADGRVHAYEGGYSAYVLARAERARIAAAEDERRRNLLRKELAWLRRGPPARTSKPKFRIDAAAALIADEPAPRDAVELAQLATSRLGKTVIELERVTVTAGGNAESGPGGQAAPPAHPARPEPRLLLDTVTWQLGPGERVGVIGVNGSGKTTLLRLLSGAIGVPGSAGGLVADGTIVTGKTVRLGYLTQEPAQLDPGVRALEAANQVRGSVRIGKRELSASQLLERLGLRGDRQWTPVAELSGGEQRRLQFQMLLMAEPNVLLLDEPTNDLDIETLTELEDLLDGFPGSVVVVSHDRYFLERVTDHVLALVGGQLAFLPGGVDEYLALREQGEPAAGGSRTLAGSVATGEHDRAEQVRAGSRRRGGSARAGSLSAGAGSVSAGVGPVSAGPGPVSAGPGPVSAGVGPVSAGAGSVSAGAGPDSRPSSAAAGLTAERQRQAKKEIARLDRQLEKLASQEADLQQALALAATDYPRLIELGGQLRALHAQKEEVEERWLALAEELSG